MSTLSDGPPQGTALQGSIVLILGNQLIDPALLAPWRAAPVVLCEDRALCTYQRFHQQKLVLVLAAMRAYAEELRCAGFDVRYQALDAADPMPLFAFLAAEASACGARRLVHVEIVGRHMAARVAQWAATSGMTVETLPDPMFHVPLALFERHLKARKRPHMAAYYRLVRSELDLLVDADGQPAGGRWSFDEDNRKRLPATLTPPPLPTLAADPIRSAVIALVAREFPDHPGRAADSWLPTTRAEARHWLADFLGARLAHFGPYEDAISRRSPTLYHSVLAPLMNIGLLTPGEIIDAALAHARAHAIPLNSLEGFVRQVVGWREFVRGIYRHVYHGEAAGRVPVHANFWQHQRLPGPAWYTGTTGIPPLDDAIRGALARGWNHHIERLMVIGNVMLLCEIAPRAAYRWFMEMYVDAYGWVMEPNVYGMGIFSDGGVFATKPYLCGANYLLKMSDYRRGPWCDIVDGLYWRLIARHQAYFAGNPRLAVIVRQLERMAPARREHIGAAAEAFLASHTLPPVAPDN